MGAMLLTASRAEELLADRDGLCNGEFGRVNFDDLSVSVALSELLSGSDFLPERCLFGFESLKIPLN
jgi:hypothetical protein